ncbi:MAG TPA: sugar transferase [Pirellulales bacterium]|nr:sugar transferase [Pirellulales bacterium]
MIIPRPVGLIVKRVQDAVFSAVCLLLCSPFLLLIAAAIKLTSKGPIFFRQERLGYRGKTFSIFKFRTMVQDAERTGNIVHVSDPRITGLGWYLRQYRIDEIPQFLNVLRGEMSIVGPRPLVPNFAHFWTAEERRRLDMPPGLTGWQQVNGAATHSWDERVAQDIWYVDHWSLWLDFKIMFRTPWVVLRANTVYGKDGQQLSAIPTQALSSVPLPASSSESQEEKK